MKIRKLWKNLFLIIFVLLCIIIQFQLEGPVKNGSATQLDYNGWQLVVANESHLIGSNKYYVVVSTIDSLSLILVLNQVTTHRAYTESLVQSKLSTFVQSQLLPEAYMLIDRNHSRWYEINIGKYSSDLAVNQFDYIPSCLPYTVLAPYGTAMPTRRGLMLPRYYPLPIPHGQLYVYRNRIYLTLAQIHQLSSHLVERNRDREGCPNEFLNLTRTVFYRAELNIKNMHFSLPSAIPIEDQRRHNRWVFFPDPLKNQLLCVTNIEPHTIYRMDPLRLHARTSSSDLFVRWRGDLVFMSTAPILISTKNLYLSVFHTSSALNILYIFDTHWPYAIQCVFNTTLPVSNHFLPISSMRMNENSDIIFEHISDTFSYPSLISRISIDELFTQYQQHWICKHNSTHEKKDKSQEVHWNPSTLLSHWNVWKEPVIGNAAILPLPKTKSLYPYVAVGRTYKHAQRNTIAHPKYVNIRVKHAQYWGAQIACLLDDNFACIHTPVELEIYEPVDAFIERLLNKSILPNELYGTEDPRLIWSETGAPIFLYAMNSMKNSAGRSRSMWIIDLRHVFPFLSTSLHIEADYYTPSLGVELAYDASQPWEKNWVPFFYDKQLFFSYTATPKITLARYHQSLLPPIWTYRNVYSASNSLSYIYEKNYPISYFEKLYNTTISQNFLIYDIHQGANALLIIDEKLSTQFYLTIIHHRIDLYENNSLLSFHYHHYSALFDSQPPFQWISMSNHSIDDLLHTLDTNSERKPAEAKYIFVTTVSFLEEDDIKRGYGTHQSRILASFGVRDRRSYVWCGTVHDLIGSQTPLY